MIVVGLTGSIGMGKTTTAEMFADEGIPVISADEIVHDLYRGEAAPLIEKAFPGSVIDDAVDRERLSAMLLARPSDFSRLEEIVHPLVRRRQDEFLARHRAAGAPVVLVDIPLLFESGAERRVDRIIVVTCDENLQRDRVLARPGMTPDKYAAILTRQTSDAEKRRRADYVIDTGQGMEAARQQVREIVAELRGDARTGEATNA